MTDAAHRPDRDAVVVERDGDVATITLDRPERRNALAAHVLTELTEALREVGASSCTGVILAANGPVFSAGHDFAEMRGATEQQAAKLFEACTATMLTLQQIPQVVVARVHALATAAGCQLVASCDLAVAGRSASFCLPGGRGGLFCHTPLVAVSRVVSRKRALEMAFTGDAIDAQTAYEWGLVNRVVDDADLVTATDDLLARATRGAPASSALGKATFYAQIDLPLAEAYEVAGEVMARATAGADAQEGIAAFLEKRRAQFAPRPTPT